MRANVAVLEVVARSLHALANDDGSVHLVVLEAGQLLGVGRKKPVLRLRLERQAIEELAAVLAEALATPPAEPGSKGAGA